MPFILPCSPLILHRSLLHGSFSSFSMLRLPLSIPFAGRASPRPNCGQTPRICRAAPRHDEGRPRFASARFPPDAGKKGLKRVFTGVITALMEEGEPTVRGEITRKLLLVRNNVFRINIPCVGFAPTWHNGDSYTMPAKICQAKSRENREKK
jgi:hypothetical protein